MYWIAYDDLSTQRLFAGGPIPGLAIMAYCREIGIDGIDDREFFAAIIKLMDQELMQYINEQRQPDG